MATNYTSPIYEPSYAVNYFNKHLPRFGFPDEITALVEGDAFSYIKGVVFLSAFMIALTIIMFVLLIVISCCKCLCSGRSTKRPRTMNIIYIVLGFMSIVACALFLSEGDGNFTEAIDGLVDVKTDLYDEVEEAYGIFGSMDTSLARIETSLDELDEQLKLGVCPTVPTEVKDYVSSAASNTLSFNFDTFKTVLKSGFMENEEKIDDALDLAKDSGVYLKYGLIPIMIMSFILAVGLLVAWYGICTRSYICFEKVLEIPMLTIMILVSLAIIVVSGIVLPICADFCTGGESNSPEGSINDILEIAVPDLEGPEVLALNYYIITGCRSENPFAELKSVEVVLDELDTIVTYSDQFKDDCAAFATFGASTLNSVADIRIQYDRTTELTSCENVNTIVVDFLHDGTCREIPKAFGWMFGTFISIWTAYMLMLVMRAIGGKVSTTDQRIYDNYDDHAPTRIGAKAF